jgi:hypothetical protein
MNKKFIYIPSFSAGVQGNSAKKNHDYKGIPARFWRDDYPFKPYKKFLLTAGHDYKKMDTRERFGLNNGSLVFGDSGGYQIASGAIKWDLSIREKIFQWLEHNSDIAMNLDIPPRINYEGKYDECLKISIDNFKYFYENQSGKTDFLNVLQGNNLNTYQGWYNKVKGFEFQGWGIGGVAGSVVRLFNAITVLSKYKEFSKKENKWLHILGVSKVSDFILLNQLQKSLEGIKSDIQVLTDSSTPNRATVFGCMYFGYDLKKMTYISNHFKRDMFSDYKEIIPMPFTSEFSNILNERGLSLNEVCEFGNNGYLAMTHNNLYVFLESIDKINYYMDAPQYLKEQIFDKDILWLCDVIDKIIKDENPEKVFLKNEMRIKQIANKLDLLDVEQQKITTNNSMFKIITE